MMKINKANIIGMSAGLIIAGVSLIFFVLGKLEPKIFYFILGISFVIFSLPFFANLLVESEKEKNKEQMFLEFTRDLAEGVKSGTPISKTIINVRNKDYGSLNPYIQKLINQITLGIPVSKALGVFARDVHNPVISRSISLIKEAERAGGSIETILDSVSFSVSQIEKLKKERKAAIYNLAVQGYIIFFIFIVIMLVMQFKILPITSELNINTGDLSAVGLAGVRQTSQVSDISSSFLYLLLSQGFFAGLVIGKISEGSIKSGLKHSLALVAMALIISTGARAFFG
jgi:flagellar protein FlaJ